jgi:prepilin-type N-terminal cleavage/methylation domain-containing protein
MLEPMSRANRHGDQGFTIIELLTAVAIAAILIALAAPSFNEFLAKRRVEGTTSELVTDMQFARSEAVSHNAPVRITFGSGCYVIHLKSVKADKATCKTDPEDSDIKTVRIDDTRLFLKPEVNPKGELMSYFEFDPVRGTAANAFASPNGRIEVCVANTSRDGCGTAAHDWKLMVVLTRLGRIETCSPNGAGYMFGYSKWCTPA